MASDAKPWYSKDTVAVVTGANQGIGLEIVRLLAEKGLTVVLTSRNQERGEAAVDGLKEKGLNSVVYHQLDTSDSESIKNLASWLKSEFGGIDILVNNAGTSAHTRDYEAAKSLFATNYYGVKNVTEALLPLLRASPAGARLITVSSRAGLFQRLKSEALKEKFRDEDKYSTEYADELAEKYLNDCKSGRADDEGWVDGLHKSYGESKMCLNIYSSSLAKSLTKGRHKDHPIYLASFCPGATVTSMFASAVKTGWTPPANPKTAAEGADDGVWLALLPKEEWPEKHGKYFANRTEYVN